MMSHILAIDNIQKILKFSSHYKKKNIILEDRHTGSLKYVKEPSSNFNFCNSFM